MTTHSLEYVQKDVLFGFNPGLKWKYDEWAEGVEVELTEPDFYFYNVGTPCSKPSDEYYVA